MRLLGLWLDADWSFGTHIGQVADRMERKMRVLRSVSGLRFGNCPVTVTSAS